MSQSGYELGVDLVNLRIVGAVDLPMLSFTYAALNNAIAQTADFDEVAFVAPGGGGRRAGVSQTWTYLRDDMQNILGEASTALDAMGRALLHVVDVYAAADAGAADTLRGAWNNGPPGLDDSERAPTQPSPPIKTA